MGRPVRSTALSVLDTLAERVFERMALLKHAPKRLLDLGTGDGRHLSALAKKYRHAEVIGTDLSLSRLKLVNARRRFWQHKYFVVCADANASLPFADNSLDLVISNMMLPWIADPSALMIEINRVLADDGALFISAAGPDSLIELRRAWACVDDSVHISDFLDMHDIGDMLVGGGIADPVIDTERLTFSYSSLEMLLEELTGLGFINTLQGRRRGLTAKSVISRLREHYPQNASGGVDATLEFVVAHGWRGAKTGSYQNDAGTEVYFPLDRLSTKR